MNVSLTPDQEKFVQQKVKTGQFASRAEVVREALDLLRAQEEEEMTPARVAELRELTQVALDEFERGETADFTAKDIQKLGRRVLAARKARSEPKPRRKRAS
jgi:antitoxin ParD1/3/4